MHMPVRRPLKHYPTNEVLGNDRFLAIKDVYEHHWLPEHSHDFPEMICVLNGKGNQYINGMPVPAKENEIYIIPLGTTHVFRPAADDTSPSMLQVRDVIFRAEWLEGLSNSWIDPEMKACIAWLLGKSVAGNQPGWIRIWDRNGEFCRHTEYLKGLILQEPSLFLTRLTAGVLELLSMFCLATETVKIQQAEWPPRTHLHPVKAQIMETIQALPMDAISAKEVAKKIEMSERHLSRLFPEHFGVSFNKYIQECRLHESMKLLRESKFSIREIIQRIGLEDTDHFYALFKQKNGITPGQYRKQHARRIRQ
jgi:AraC family L-rhamnose operon transcriptional activator RhaR